MKLYNCTTIPDEALEPLLVRAGRSIGALTAGVVVIVNRGKRGDPTSSGEACRSAWVRPLLRRKRGTRRFVGLRAVKTDGGYIRIVLPHWTADPLDSAESFFDTAQHEWKHVKDFQDGIWEWSRRGRGGRRPPWATRPEEQRAMAACEDAALLGRGPERAYEEITALALALEAERGVKLAEIAVRPSQPRLSFLSRCGVLARSLGATTKYDRADLGLSCRAETPKGSHWAATGCHELAENSWRRLLKNMEMGLEPCEPGCDCFEDEGDGP